MDGMSATRAIRQYEQTYKIPRCFIIALTGLSSNSARLEAWNCGIDQYMTKPVNFVKLAEVLRKEKERKESEKLARSMKKSLLLEESQSESAVNLPLDKEESVV